MTMHIRHKVCISLDNHVIVFLFLFFLSKSVRNEFSSESVCLHYKGHETALFLVHLTVVFSSSHYRVKNYDSQ